MTTQAHIIVITLQSCYIIDACRAVRPDPPKDEHIYNALLGEIGRQGQARRASPSEAEPSSVGGVEDYRERALRDQAGGAVERCAGSGTYVLEMSRHPRVDACRSVCSAGGWVKLERLTICQGVVSHPRRATTRRVGRRRDWLEQQGRDRLARCRQRHILARGGCSLPARAHAGQGCGERAHDHGLEEGGFRSCCWTGRGSHTAAGRSDLVGIDNRRAGYRIASIRRAPVAALVRESPRRGRRWTRAGPATARRWFGRRADRSGSDTGGRSEEEEGVAVHEQGAPRPIVCASDWMAVLVMQMLSARPCDSRRRRIVGIDDAAVREGASGPADDLC